jgi:hypothetical protein
VIWLIPTIHLAAGMAGLLLVIVIIINLLGGFKTLRKAEV